MFQSVIDKMNHEKICDIGFLFKKKKFIFIVTENISEFRPPALNHSTERNVICKITVYC